MSKMKSSRFKRIRSFHVFQPAVPMRVVNVVLNDDGTHETFDSPVLGIQGTLTDAYWCPGEKRFPSSPSNSTLAQEGFRLEDQYGFDIEYELIVWDEEYQTATGIKTDSFDGSTNVRRVIGPRDMPSGWWEDQIQERVAFMKEQKESAK